MKGKAPKSSFTGSQLLENMNPKPNLSLLSAESEYISYAIYSTNATIVSANISVRFSKRISPSFFLLFISFLESSVELSLKLKVES